MGEVLFLSSEFEWDMQTSNCKVGWNRHSRDLYLNYGSTGEGKTMAWRSQEGDIQSESRRWAGVFQKRKKWIDISSKGHSICVRDNLCSLIVHVLPYCFFKISCSWIGFMWLTLSEWDCEPKWSITLYPRHLRVGVSCPFLSPAAIYLAVMCWNIWVTK